MKSHTKVLRSEDVLRQLSAANIRAGAGDPQLDLRGGYLYRDEHLVPLRSPHLYPQHDRDSLVSFRGACDGMAARCRHSDSDLHATLAPDKQIAAFVFDILEQFRTEHLASGLPGVRANLRGLHEQWARQFHSSDLTETELGLRLYTLAQVCRSRITGEPVLAETEDLIEGSRGDLIASAGPHLAGLRRDRGDQRAFASHALHLAAWAQSVASTADAVIDRSQTNGHISNFSLLVPFEDAANEYGRPGDGTGSESFAPGDYTRFTTAYDRVIRVQTLVRQGQLRAYRERIDHLAAAKKLNPTVLARNLEVLLCAPRESGFVGGHEDGYVDGSRLGGLVTAPAERRIFRQPRTESGAASSVAFLVDCSGSMKVHAEGVAVLVETFVRALDQVDVSSEVLGFTTGDWNGGRPARDWLRAGSPAKPGRLNELQHLVFKDADTNWRNARPSIAGLLKASLYREGVDGEAVEWAAARLASKSEQRRILIVISDGSPSDTATTRVNTAEYLDRHLSRAVTDAESRHSIFVYGVGLGMDMSRYFRRSLILDTDSLGSRDSIHDLFDLLRRTLPPLV